MKKCRHCGAEMNDNVVFCTNCGTKMEDKEANMNHAQQGQNNYGGPQMAGGYANPNANAYQPYTAAPVNPYDHTAEFDPKDISDNKVLAMLVYLMGAVGIIIALLASNTYFETCAIGEFILSVMAITFAFLSIANFIAVEIW